MPGKTKIQWASDSWNPVTGCTEISPGCNHCYAKTLAERWRGIPGHPYEQGFDLKLWPKRLEIPGRWKKPRLIFVNSMSDLFHEDIPSEFIQKTFDAMRAAHWHTFQVLTKRPKRMRDFEWPDNVWAGTSIENKYFQWRTIPLREVDAKVRFLSIEPLIGELINLDLTGIHWVIVGGESGPGARPMNLDWVRSIRDQCASQKVPFFFKQIGGVNKKKTGRLLDGREHNEMPKVGAQAN